MDTELKEMLLRLTIMTLEVAARKALELPCARSRRRQRPARKRDSDPTAVPIASANLAYQASVTASASLPDERPSNAVDENIESQWGAGRDAPQWIEVDLRQAYDISEIRLLVAQWLEGVPFLRWCAARPLDPCGFPARGSPLKANSLPV